MKTKKETVAAQGTGAASATLTAKAIKPKTKTQGKILGFFVKRKKALILTGMAALLIVTGYLNLTLNNKVVDTGTQSQLGFFATYRTDRIATRNQEIAFYDAIIANTSSSAEAKATAETKKEQLIALIDSELIIEGLIKAKGFNDVIISNSAKNINVIVKCSSLEQYQRAQIIAVIQEQTGKSIEFIKIIPTE